VNIEAFVKKPSFVHVNGVPEGYSLSTYAKTIPATAIGISNPGLFFIPKPYPKVSEDIPIEPHSPYFCDI
jgi:hypothetical protein